VRDAAVFETTCVDMALPLFLRDGRHVWVCLYSCAIKRAVHLELVSLLSSDSIIQTFRRFVSRRGWPAFDYRDNGTNFVGKDNAFGHLEGEKSPNTVILSESTGGLTFRPLPGGEVGGSV